MNKIDIGYLLLILPQMHTLLFGLTNTDIKALFALVGLGILYID